VGPGPPGPSEPRAGPGALCALCATRILGPIRAEYLSVFAASSTGGGTADLVRSERHGMIAIRAYTSTEVWQHGGLA
jgi:hypothetical protein